MRLQEKLDEVGAGHVACQTHLSGAVCHTCRAPWPCETAEAILRDREEGDQ